MTDPSQLLLARVLDWYDANARVLPWREPTASPWAVMVSEFMLQQTPVARVLPVYETWMEQWPTPDALAAVPTGDAVRAWGRLGYPRRALRLHAAAVAITEEHSGIVPLEYDQLLRLPGVGDYTAAAISAFAYRQRTVVLDTNIRRVLARALSGEEFPAASVTKAERMLAESLVPEDGDTAANWSVGVMELGALVCTASNPGCGICPLAEVCAWRLAGQPAYDGPARKAQTYAGTDRQCRGRLLAVVRDAHEPVHRSRLDIAWSDPDQRIRCLDSLLEDGLIARVGPETYALP